MTDPLPGSKQDLAAARRKSRPADAGPIDPAIGLPAAVDMERCALSCLMQAPDFCGAIGLRLLSPDDFSVDAYGQLFDIMSQRIQIGNLVDPVSLTQELFDRGLIEKMGGPAFVTEIYTASPNPAHFEHYAREVVQKATARRVVLACSAAMHGIMSEPTRENTADLAAGLVDAVLQATAETDRTKVVHLSDAIGEAMEDLDKTIANRGHVTGEMATGFTDLDRVWITGMRRTENIVIAGDTSMGKTSLALQILENITTGTGHYKEFYNYPGHDRNNRIESWQAEVESGRAVSRFGKKTAVLVCLESSQVEMALKLLMGRAGVNLLTIQGGMISKSDMAAIGKSGRDLGESQLYIWDAAGVTVEELSAEMKNFKMQHGEKFACLCVDHCGLLGARGVRDHGNETAVAGYVSSSLRNLYKKLDVVGLSLWQLNREAATKGQRGQRPTRADLRSSGRIEQDASRILMPYRPGHYSDDDDVDASEAYLIIAKNRGGPLNLTGIQTRWEGESARFYSEQKDEDGQWRPRHRLFSLKDSEQQIR